MATRRRRHVATVFDEAERRDRLGVVTAGGALAGATAADRATRADARAKSVARRGEWVAPQKSS